MDMPLDDIPEKFKKKAVAVGEEYIKEFVQNYIAKAVGQNAIVTCNVDSVKSLSGEMWEDMSFFDTIKIDDYDKLVELYEGTLTGKYLKKVRVEVFEIHTLCRVIGEATLDLHIVASTTLFFNFLISPHVMLRELSINGITVFTPALGKVKFDISSIRYNTRSGRGWEVSWSVYEKSPVEQILRDLTFNPQIGEKHLIPWAKSIHQRVVDYFKDRTYSYPFTWREGGIIEFKLVDIIWLTNPHLYHHPEDETPWRIIPGGSSYTLYHRPPALVYKFELHFAPTGAPLYTTGASFILVWTIALTLTDYGSEVSIDVKGITSHLDATGSIERDAMRLMEYTVPIKRNQLPSPATAVPIDKLQSLNREIANTFVPHIIERCWKYVKAQQRDAKKKIHPLGTARMSYLFSLVAAEIGARILSLPSFVNQIATPFPPNRSPHWRWPLVKLEPTEDSLIKKSHHILPIVGKAKISVPLQRKRDSIILSVTIHVGVPIRDDDKANVLVSVKVQYIEDGTVMSKVLLKKDWSTTIQIDQHILEYWHKWWQEIFSKKQHLFTLPKNMERVLNFLFARLAEQIKDRFPYHTMDTLTLE